jgi:hypothetical protein
MKLEASIISCDDDTIQHMLHMRYIARLDHLTYVLNEMVSDCNWHFIQTCLGSACMLFHLRSSKCVEMPKTFCDKT